MSAYDEIAQWYDCWVASSMQEVFDAAMNSYQNLKTCQVPVPETEALRTTHLILM